MDLKLFSSNKILKKRSLGVSLIEMVIVLAILSVLSLILSRFLVHGFTTYRLSREGIDSEEKAARVMRDFEFSLRAATAISLANDEELAFYRYFDLTSVAPKRIRYFMDGNVFKVGITEPIGTAPNISYPSENEKIDYLIENVTELKFQFFDDNNQEMTLPVNLTAIRMASLLVTIDQDSNQEPPPISQSTKVNLRI